MEIRDGTGTGKLAKVDVDNELLTRAAGHTEESEVSIRKGRAFYINSADTADTLTLTATGGPILYMKNTSPTRIIILEKVFLSTDTAGVVVKWIKNMTLGTIGNENTHTPPNLNFASGHAAEGTFYNWDEVGDGMTGLSGGTALKPYILGVGVTVLPIDGAIVLGQGNSFVINAKIAAEFECGVRFYYETAEE